MKALRIDIDGLLKMPFHMKSDNIFATVRGLANFTDVLCYEDSDFLCTFG